MSLQMYHDELFKAVILVFTLKLALHIQNIPRQIPIKEMVIQLNCIYIRKLIIDIYNMTHFCVKLFVLELFFKFNKWDILSNQRNHRQTPYNQYVLYLILVLKSNFTLLSSLSNLYGFCETKRSISSILVVLFKLTLSSSVKCKLIIVIL